MYIRIALVLTRSTKEIMTAETPPKYQFQNILDEGEIEDETLNKKRRSTKRKLTLATAAALGKLDRPIEPEPVPVTPTGSEPTYKKPFNCNPCICCVSCGFGLRICCIPIILFYLTWSSIFIFFAVRAQLAFGENAKKYCTPELCKANSSTTAPDNDTLVNCDLVDKCVSNVKSFLICGYLQPAFWFPCAICLAVVIITVKYHVLVYVSIPLALIGNLIIVIQVYFIVISERHEQTDYVSLSGGNRSGKSGVTISGILAALTFPIIIYFSLCALALCWRIQAGEYEPVPVVVDAPITTMKKHPAHRAPSPLPSTLSQAKPAPEIPVTSPRNKSTALAAQNQPSPEMLQANPPKKVGSNVSSQTQLAPGTSTPPPYKRKVRKKPSPGKVARVPLKPGSSRAASKTKIKS